MKSSLLLISLSTLLVASSTINSKYNQETFNQVKVRDTSSYDNCEILGHFGKDYWGYNSVYIQDSFALTAKKYYFEIINVKDSSNPVLLGKMKCPYIVKDIYSEDSLAYVATGDSGLRIIDFSDPRNPHEVGFFNCGEEAISVYKSGEFVYLCYYVYAQKDELRIIDVSNPEIPLEVGYTDTCRICKSIVVKDTLAYVVAGEDGLIILDVSNPESPQQIGSYNISIEVIDIQVRGNEAYIITHSSANTPSFIILDVSDPELPVVKAAIQFDNSYFCRALQIFDTLAYIGDNMGGYDDGRVHLVSIQDPYSPVYRGYYTHITSCLAQRNATGGSISDLFVKDDLLYILNTLDGLRIIDISNPSSMREIEFYDNVDMLFDVDVSDTLAYIADGGYGLKILNVAEPDSIKIIGAYDTLPVVDIHLVDTLVYLANPNRGMSIVNIKNPSNPIGVSSLIIPSCNPKSIFKSGSYAYIADKGSYSLRIINVSDPYSPVEAGTYSFDYMVHDVFVKDTFAYILTHKSYEPEPYDPSVRDELRVINVSNPASPQQIGIYQATGYSAGVSLSLFVRDSIAYVSQMGGDFNLFDVSPPNNPTLIGSHERGLSCDVHVVDTLAYTVGYNRMDVFNINDPTNPVLEGFHGLPRDLDILPVNIEGIYSEDGLIYAADRAYGLFIMRYDTALPGGVIEKPTPEEEIFLVPSIVIGNIIEVKCEIDKNFNIEIYDIMGRKIKIANSEPGRNTINVDVSNITSGVYFIMIKGSESKIVKKVSIIR